MEGVNTGTADLLMLRANRIYERRNDLPRLVRLIDDVHNTGGWLIFYTHDVTEQPTPFGCSPRAFEHLLEASVNSGCKVLPVGEALADLRTATTRGATP